jgi:hypothetical protein
MSLPEIKTGTQLLKTSWEPTEAQRAKWKAKWEAMSPEERAQYLAEIDASMGAARDFLAASPPSTLRPDGE